MSTQYSCQKPLRRAVVLAGDSGGNPIINGIDYLEVASSDQKTLNVHFLFPLPGQPKGVPASPALTSDNVIIQGGARITGITVQSAVTNPNHDPQQANLLQVKVSAAGDFSTYTLGLVTSAINTAPPTGFDPQLSSLDFSFKAACPSNFDCQQTSVCPLPALPTAQIDYLAKDYASFRQLLLDRLALIMPQWQETHPADIGIALVELLSYAGDQLSYYQDAVATEAYLGTARQRVSVRRHARLLDYFMHDGCNARAWVFLETASTTLPNPPISVSVPAQSMLLTQITSPRGPVSQDVAQAAVNQGSQVFQTLFAITAHQELNELCFYTWSDQQCCLPQGATKATLEDKGAGALVTTGDFKAGDLMLFEEVISPASGDSVDADPAHRQVVRLTKVSLSTDPLNRQKIIEIEWLPADALTFPLCLSTAAFPNAKISVARGNIVLADHGMSQQLEQLPQLPRGNALYRPQLQNANLTFAVAYDEVKARTLPVQPAMGVLIQDPHQASPLITLVQNGSTWTPFRDLLSSPGNALNFVVETQNDGSAQLRFGNGTLGAPPVGGLFANYRTGNGTAGNVGAESIAHIVAGSATPFTGIVNVRNPLPAQGGVDGETLDEVRSFAPWAFRTQERAVATKDYATVAQLHSEVKKAEATLRWTGSWYTMFLTVERINGQPVDAAFRDQISSFLEDYRLAGYDVEVEAPIFIPLDIALTICVAPGYFRSAVEAALLDAFSNRILLNGQPGFFYPDNFTFGQPVYLSQVVSTAMQVPGVSWVNTSDLPESINGLTVPSQNRFQRWGQAAQGEIAAGKISMARLEIARLDNDPSEPENGRIQFSMEGGL